MLETNGSIVEERGPRAEYTRRLSDRREAAARHHSAHVTLGNARVGAVTLIAVVAYLIFARHLLATWWLLLPLVLFVVLTRRHEGVIERLRRAKRGVAYYERAMRRLDDDWQRDGVSGSRFLSAEHPYANDLGIFGPDSLFRRINTARTEAGEASLAHWLSAPASPEDIRLRQEALAELRARIDLREELSGLGDEVRASLDPAEMQQWGSTPPVPGRNALRLQALLLALANCVGIGLAAALQRYWPFGITALLTCLFTYRVRNIARHTIAAVEKPARSLALLALLLGRLESESFESPLLCSLAQRMDLASRPSGHVARLQRLCELLEFRRSELLRPIDIALQWTFQMVLAIEGWRSRHGSRIAEWLAAYGEMEALLSLATYAYERPDDTFPEIVETERLLEGTAVGHPLIPAKALVRNDIHLNESRRLLIVSGSNMSGKSTYLRTIGINVVLALAGAPVCAEGLRLSMWQSGTSIQTIDSLHGGISRFYAELLRVRQIVELTSGALPVLFLLDEILHGTNSHDRLIGAEAIVRSLVRRGAFGLVTTHDLALARITADPGLAADNIHFADEIVNDQMAFDYRVRPGVVQQSNALALMRLVGLDL